MRKFTLFNLCFFFIFLMWGNSLFARFSFDRVEVVRVLEREDHSLKIKKMIPMKWEDRAFTQSYWKVYYFKDQIVAEELYERTYLVYYYIYYHEKDKIYQKGFFWHGIYSDLKYFKAHEKNLKQGWMYKNYPESYQVYDASSLKKIYSHHYQDFES